MDKFKAYVTEKNRINHILFDFYSKQLFRKLKFGRHINIKRNEQKMMSEFKKMYGNPENVVICIGDWEQRKQMKYKEPTFGKGIRTLFRKNNYNDTKIFESNEFYFSQVSFDWDKKSNRKNLSRKGTIKAIKILKEHILKLNKIPDMDKLNKWGASLYLKNNLKI